MILDRGLTLLIIAKLVAATNALPSEAATNHSTAASAAQQNAPNDDPAAQTERSLLIRTPEIEIPSIPSTPIFGPVKVKPPPTPHPSARPTSAKPTLKPTTAEPTTGQPSPDPTMGEFITVPPSYSPDDGYGNITYKAEDAVWSDAQGNYYFRTYHRQPQLYCAASGDKIVETTFRGVACDGSANKILWVHARTVSEDCNVYRSGRVEAWLREYLGFCGRTPRNVRLPTNIHSKKFTMDTLEYELGAFQGKTARITYYGAPCSQDPTQIYWQWIQIQQPQPQNPLRGGTKEWVQNTIMRNNGNKDAYFGSCGVPATRMPAPTHTNFVYYIKQNHTLRGLCATPDKPTTTWFIGYECGSSYCYETGGLRWTRIFTPQTTFDENEYCRPSYHEFDPIAANVVGHPSMIEKIYTS